jgi:hypothetical protein
MLQDLGRSWAMIEFSICEVSDINYASPYAITFRARNKSFISTVKSLENNYGSGHCLNAEYSVLKVF